jgi:hypothetical protein
MLKRSVLKRKQKTEEQIQQNKDDVHKMQTFFIKCWEKRQDENGNVKCFETGKLMPKQRYMFLTTCYHHCLPKSVYEELKYTDENIVIILPEVHIALEADYDKAPRVKEYTKQLKDKYGRISDNINE